MKEHCNIAVIPLTQDKYTILDCEDFEFLNQWRWYANKNGNSYYVIRSNHLGMVNGKKKHLGYFLDERDAAMAYEKEVRKLGQELVCKLKK